MNETDCYGVIYCLKNKHNGKCYVGQHVNGTEYSLEDRMAGHRQPKSNCIAFRRAIQKYGWDSFVLTIVCECEVNSQKRLNALEKYFIIKKNSLAPNGYNLRDGGSNGRPCDESKQNMSEGQKKRMSDPEERARIAERQKQFAEKNPDAMKRHSEFMKERCKNNPEKVLRGENHYNFGRTGEQNHSSKKVDQYSKDGKTFIKTWNCLLDVERDLKIFACAISCVCKGKYKSAGGFFWRYATATPVE